MLGPCQIQRALRSIKPGLGFKQISEGFGQLALQGSILAEVEARKVSSSLLTDVVSPSAVCRSALVMTNSFDACEYFSNMSRSDSIAQCANCFASSIAAIATASSTSEQGYVFALLSRKMRRFCPSNYAAIPSCMTNQLPSPCAVPTSFSSSK